MSVTSLQITKEGEITRIKIMTLPSDVSGIIIDAYNCNEEFIPVGKPLQSTDPRDEETYHRELRKLAEIHGQFVKEESTDSDWNPE